jgi:cbb3-type cytochrome oxidase subunit 3
MGFQVERGFLQLAKIGVGATLVLIVVVIGVVWFVLRRRRRKIMGRQA